MSCRGRRPRDLHFGGVVVPVSFGLLVLFLVDSPAYGGSNPTHPVTEILYYVLGNEQVEIQKTFPVARPSDPNNSKISVRTSNLGPKHRAPGDPPFHFRSPYVSLPTLTSSYGAETLQVCLAHIFPNQSGSSEKPGAAPEPPPKRPPGPRPPESVQKQDRGVFHSSRTPRGL
ncbi:hypothetical protein B0H11DRAFT_2212399 [Mycena galericulata]|nr:hypothetical protein B0H11DRAFT_2212399 [Mycena galericulata]